MSNFNRWKWPIILTAFALLHIVVFTRVFYHGGPDVECYYRYAVQIGQGLVPYRDFAVEYPPGALATFYLPYFASHNLHIFSDNVTGYGTAFTIEMLLFDVAGLLMVYSLARKARLSPLLCLVGYTLAAVAIGDISVQRFDMVPAVIMLAAVFAFSRGSYKTAWAVLAVGTLTKLFPAVLAPLFLIYQWRKGGFKQLIPSLAVFAAASVAIAVPFLFINAEGFKAAFTEQSGRALQLESLYSSLLLLASSLGITTATPIQGPISFDLSAPLSAPLARYSLLVMGVGMLAVYFGYFKTISRGKGIPRAGVEGADLVHLASYAFLTLTAVLLTSKVFSPQFLVWLLPLFPLVGGRFRGALWVLFLIAACLTWYIYPLHYYDLVDTRQVAVDALILRNALLVLAAVLLAGEKVPPNVPGSLPVSSDKSA